MGSLTHCLPILLLCIAPMNSVKVLVFNPGFGFSHINYLGALADTLTEAGHDVTVLYSIMDPDNENKTGCKTTEKIIKVSVDKRAEVMGIDAKNGMYKNMWTIKPDPIAMFKHVHNMSQIFAYQCERIVLDKKLMDGLRAEHFDVGIYEPFDICGAGIFEVIGLKTKVAALSCGMTDIVAANIGQPLAPSYVPGLMATTGDKMSFFTRLNNAIGTVVGYKFFDVPFQGGIDMLRKHFGSDFKGYADLLNECSFVFTNSNPLLDFPSPQIAKVIPLGGITVNVKDGKLSKEWDDILNIRKKNVFISFGSVVKSKDMPEEYKASFLKVFESMPDTTFIWKYEIEEATFTDHLPNVKLTSWAPQMDLLKDPRLSVFITHGGLGSTNELAFLGTPAIMIPVFADQSRNAEMLKRHGGALVFNKYDLDYPDKLKTAIETAISTPSYRENAQKLSSMLRNAPSDVRKTFVTHVEFAAEFGQLPNLVPYGRNLTMLQYYLVDVMAFVVATILIVLYIVYKLLQYAITKLFGGKSKLD